MSSATYLKYEKATGKLTIKAKESLESLMPELPKNSENIFEIFAKIDEIIKDEIKNDYPSYPEAKTQGALNKIHGDWYEWILGILAWNFHVENPGSYIAAQLPNVSSFDCPSLYIKNLYSKIADLKNKVSERNVELISSNPDFVLIDPAKTSASKTYTETDSKTKKIDKITVKNIEFINGIYEQFTGACEFNGIAGYMSAKTSYRPDRRLQIPHEASLMKAMYMHLQTRDWIIDPKGIRYYAVSLKLGDADKEAFKTIATHSITSVLIKPERAVDEAFEIKTADEAYAAFKTILHPLLAE